MSGEHTRVECPVGSWVVVEWVSGPGRENQPATKQTSPTPIAISLFLTLPKQCRGEGDLR